MWSASLEHGSSVRCPLQSVFPALSWPAGSGLPLRTKIGEEFKARCLHKRDEEEAPQF